MRGMDERRVLTISIAPAGREQFPGAKLHVQHGWCAIVRACRAGAHEQQQHSEQMPSVLATIMKYKQTLPLCAPCAAEWQPTCETHSHACVDRGPIAMHHRRQHACD